MCIRPIDKMGHNQENKNKNSGKVARRGERWVIDNLFDGTTAVPDSATITFRGCTAPILIQGNEFYNFNGSTFTFTSSATSNVTVQYNYFDANTLYKIGTAGSTNFTYVSNYYAATSQTTSTSDYGVLASKDALDAAYAAYKATLE